MTQEQVLQLLDSYSPDHYPAITFHATASFAEFRIKFNDEWSIIKFTDEYYSGAYELYSSKYFDDVFRSTALQDCVDQILAIHPLLLFNPINSPERFL